MVKLDINTTYRQHEDNKWEYRLRFKDPFTAKPAERSKRGFRTKGEAKKAAEKRQDSLQQTFEQENMPLKDFLDFWLSEYKRGKIAPNTYKSLNNSIKNHIKPYFKNIRLKNLTPSEYQKFLNYLWEEKKLARNTLKNVHNAIYGALKRAVINEVLAKNPCEHAVIPGKVSKKKDTLDYIDSSEVAKFLEYAYKYGYIYWIFFKMLIETGVRKGEAAALQWYDIDFKNRTATINKSLDFEAQNEEDLLGDPKTFSSDRTITLSKSLVDDLRYHLHWQNQNKKVINDIYHHDLNLVFCRKDGNFMPKSTLFNAFSRILKNAGLQQLPIHSLRHTHAVLLLESGADMKYIQERLGHGSYRITADIYSHVSAKMKQKNIAQFEEYMDDILK